MSTRINTILGASNVEEFEIADAEELSISVCDFQKNVCGIVVEGDAEVGVAAFWLHPNELIQLGEWLIEQGRERLHVSGE